MSTRVKNSLTFSEKCEAKNFIKKFGNVYTNKEISEKFNVKQSCIGGLIASMKRNEKFPNKFLLTDIRKQVEVKKTKKTMVEVTTKAVVNVASVAKRPVGRPKKITSVLVQESTKTSLQTTNMVVVKLGDLNKKTMTEIKANRSISHIQILR
jgi:hypothetical protein